MRDALVPQLGEVPDGVADLLAQVVSAGAPGEEPVVERIIEIRQALAAIGASTSIAAPALLDEDELDVVDLLRADLSADGSPGARAVAVAATWGPRRARTRSKNARSGPGVFITFHATSPSMWRASDAPVLEIRPWRAGPLPDWWTRGSRPR